MIGLRLSHDLLPSYIEYTKRSSGPRGSHTCPQITMELHDHLFGNSILFGKINTKIRNTIFKERLAQSRPQNRAIIGIDRNRFQPIVVIRGEEWQDSEEGSLAIIARNMSL
jgi:hypothetical protein